MSSLVDYEIIPFLSKYVLIPIFIPSFVFSVIYFFKHSAFNLHSSEFLNKASKSSGKPLADDVFSGGKRSKKGMSNFPFIHKVTDDSSFTRSIAR